MDETIDQTARTQHQLLKLAGPAVSGNAHARREFLRLVGLGAGAAALAACAGDLSKVTGATAGTPAAAAGTGPAATAGTVTYDFGRADDLGTLNFAYAMEQLGMAFYRQVTSNSAFASIFSTTEQQILRDFLGHETAHRDFFAAALGTAGITVTPQFPSSGTNAVDFTNRLSVLQHARTFENTCVFALNGAGGYLHSGAYLAIAGKLVSVEARQASALNDLLNPKASGTNDVNNSPIFAQYVVDPGYTPQQVVSIVSGYIAETINLQNT